MKVSIVAAVAHGGVIGRDGGLPWRLPEDMVRFRELTMGHPVVMGRRTWDSLPDRFRPLPGRGNVVVTRNPDWSAQGADRAGSIEHALGLLESDPQVFVIGGGEIYAAALPFADELLLTDIDADVDGDTTFPEWDREAFEETSRETHVSEDGTPFAFVTYRRNAASRQLAALAGVDARFEHAGLAYWLFGGWAVDFYAGSITRPHDDVDIAVWRDDLRRLAVLLEEDGWVHAPAPDEDGGTGYERDGVRLELTFLVRDDAGRIVTPLRDGAAAWPEHAFADDARELLGARARLVSLDALRSGKSSPRDDPADAVKDEADFATLSPSSIPAVVANLHVSRESLDARLPDLRALSTEQGTLELIVVRPSEGERELPSTAELTVEDGLIGDRWRASAHIHPDGSVNRENQLTLMSTRVLAGIAEPQRWPESGDNLLVDMGLDLESLPVGSRLAIGDEVIVKISEVPHTGCAKFSARFGSDALKFVNSPEGRQLRLRGVNAHVVVPGAVAVGDGVRRL